MWCTRSKTINRCYQYGRNLTWMLNLCSLSMISLTDLPWMFVAREQREKWSRTLHLELLLIVFGRSLQRVLQKLIMMTLTLPQWLLLLVVSCFKMIKVTFWKHFQINLGIALFWTMWFGSFYFVWIWPVIWVIKQLLLRKIVLKLLSLCRISYIMKANL